MMRLTSCSMRLPSPSATAPGDRRVAPLARRGRPVVPDPPPLADVAALPLALARPEDFAEDRFWELAEDRF
jgi:hypothetical protein